MGNLRVEIKWALIFVLVSLLWMVFEKSMGWHGEHIDKHPTYTNFYAIPAILVFVLALLDKRKSLGGVMNWKQGFIAGLIITVFIAILSPLSQWITHSFITPDYFNNAIEYSLETGKTTEEDARKFFTLGNYIVLSLVSGIIMGVITSAIVALFVRKS